MNSHYTFIPLMDSKSPLRWAVGASICLALAITMGIAFVWACLAGWALNFVRVAPISSIQVIADGTPVIVKRDRDDRQNRYFTLDGKPYPNGEPNNWLSPANVPAQETSTASESLITPTISSLSDGLPSPTPWYFVTSVNPVGKGFFVGYDFQTRRRVGYIGRNGFQESEPTIDQAFEVTSRDHQIFLAPYSWGLGSIILSFSDSQSRPGKISPWICHIVSNDHLYEIDLRKRTAKSIYQAPQMLSVSQSQRPRKNALPGSENIETLYEDYLAVRVMDGVTVLDSTGRVKSTYHLPPKLERRWFSFYLGPEGKAVAVFLEVNRRAQGSSWNVIEFSQNGTVSREALDVIVPPTTESPVTAARFSFVIPEPVLPLSIVFLLGWLLPDPGREPLGYLASVSKVFAMYWPMLLLTTVFGIVSLGLYWRHAGRFGYPRRVAWMVFVFLLGPPGFVGYLLHRRWPVRIACPSCRMDAPRDRESCVACGAEFPAPTPNGLEVFA